MARAEGDCQPDGEAGAGGVRREKNKKQKAKGNEGIRYSVFGIRNWVFVKREKMRLEISEQGGEGEQKT